MWDAGNRTWQWWTSALHISVGVPWQPNHLITAYSYIFYTLNPHRPHLFTSLFITLSLSSSIPELVPVLMRRSEEFPSPSLSSFLVFPQNWGGGTTRGMSFPICTDECSPCLTPGRVGATFRVCLRLNNNQIQWYAANYSCSSWKAVTFTYK